MLNNSEIVNATSAVVAAGSTKLFTLRVFYVVGIIGSALALLHLYQKQNFKNKKHAFMLK